MIGEPPKLGPIVPIYQVALLNLEKTSTSTNTHTSSPQKIFSETKNIVCAKVLLCVIVGLPENR
jgi:hypothetical protein